MNREDYTELAYEIYEKTLYHGYKFLKRRNLNSWLAYTWGTLFKRKLEDREIDFLIATCKERHNLNLKIKTLGFKKLNHKERTTLKCKWIGSDGYVYMRKIIPFNEEQCKKWAKRDEELFFKAKVEREFKQAYIRDLKEKLIEKEAQDLKWEAQKQYAKNYMYIKDGKIYDRGK